MTAQPWRRASLVWSLPSSRLDCVISSKIGNGPPVTNTPPLVVYRHRPLRGGWESPRCACGPPPDEWGEKIKQKMSFLNTIFRLYWLLFGFVVVVLFFGNNLESSLSSLLYYISVFNHSADKTITKSKEDREWCIQKTCIWGRQQPSIHLPVCGGGNANIEFLSTPLPV